MSQDFLAAVSRLVESLDPASPEDQIVLKRLTAFILNELDYDPADLGDDDE